MTAIHKQLLAVADRIQQLPTDQVVHVECQIPSTLTVWYIDRPHAVMNVQTVGTGHELPAGAKHLGTVVDRSFVWHLMQVPA